MLPQAVAALLAARAPLSTLRVVTAVSHVNLPIATPLQGVVAPL